MTSKWTRCNIHLPEEIYLRRYHFYIWPYKQTQGFGAESTLFLVQLFLVLSLYGVFLASLRVDELLTIESFVCIC